MTIDAAENAAPGIIQRARAILLQPTEEWPRIAAEATPVAVVVTRYLMPLVVAVAAAGLLGALLMTGFFLGGGMLVQVLIGAAAQVVFALVSVLLLGVLINVLAPGFGSERNMGNAIRLSIYSATAVLAAGLTLILPVLAFLTMIAGAVYSGMLLYFGLPSMMKTPENRRVTYTLAVMAIAIVGGLLLSMVYSNLIARVQTGPSYAFGQQAPSSPESAGDNLTALQRQAFEGSGGITVRPERVHDQLPQSLPGGFELVSSTSGAENEVARAEGVYRAGNAELTLTVMQTGAMSGLLGMAESLVVEEIWQGGDGYARSQTVDGRLYAERVHAGGADYGVLGRGVAVRATGTNVTLDQVRAAVETVGVQRLEREFGV